MVQLLKFIRWLLFHMSWMEIDLIDGSKAHVSLYKRMYVVVQQMHDGWWTYAVYDGVEGTI